MEAKCCATTFLHGLSPIVRASKTERKRYRTAVLVECRCGDSRSAEPLSSLQDVVSSRRTLTAGAALLALGIIAEPAVAFPGFEKSLKPNRRKLKIPDSEYKDGPEGLRFYDVEVGTGAVAQQGSRVAVHYDAYWKGVTFMTSRQGMGVTGGTPLGFDVGAKEAGGTLKGLDLGVRGMRVGGQRKLIVPPELAYGERGMREIPPNATLTMDVQLLSIKTSPFGYRTKIVEG